MLALDLRRGISSEVKAFAGFFSSKIGNFTVICLMTCPWIGSETGVTLF